MNVLLISQDGKLCAVCEQPDGVRDQDILNCWKKSQGLSQDSQFSLNGAPVIPWSELQVVSVPYCDQKWVIMSLDLKSQDNLPVFWGTGGWGVLEKAIVSSGYVKENGISEKCQPAKWVYVGK